MSAIIECKTQKESHCQTLARDLVSITIIEFEAHLVKNENHIMRYYSTMITSLTTYENNASHSNNKLNPKKKEKKKSF